MFPSIAALVVLLDQLSKHFILTSMETGESFPVIDGLLWFTAVKNTGAAYSLFSGHTKILSAVSLVILILLTVFVLKFGKRLPKTELFCFGLIAGGGAGNILDRLFLGFVIDFIDIKILPVFNAADIAITTGCMLMLAKFFIIEPAMERRRKIQIAEAVSPPAEAEFPAGKASGKKE